MSPQKSDLGYGWTSPYHRGIEKVGSFLVLRFGTGQGNVIEKINGVWTADADASFSLTQTASGFAVNYTDGRAETYDTDGHLLNETDKAGRATIYTYSSSKLASITDPYGHTLVFSYNADGLLASMTDPAGQMTSYTYDANSNLTGVTHPDGSTRTYHYENTSFKHALTGITDENGDRYLNNHYDANGLAVMNELAGGQEHFDLQFNADSQTTVTDAAGTAVVLTYTKNLGIKNPVTVLNQSDSKATTRVYDANNNLVSITDDEGRTTTYAYNAANQRTSMTEAAGTPEARTTTYQYLSSEINLPTLVTSPSVYSGGSKTTTTTYASNLPVTITQSGFRPDGTTISRAVSMTYTPSGQVATIDGPRTDVNDLTIMTYYDCSSGGGCGQLKSVTNALGQSTTYDNYDANGRVTQVTNPNGLVTSYTYDVRGRVLSTAQSSGGQSRVVSFTYDPVGQLKTATDAGGRVLTYSYNAAHELVQVTDNLGNKVVYAYDSRGNRTTTQTLDPDGTLVRSIQTSFDARNRAAIVNAGGSITQRVFDATGNLISETDPNNNPATTHGIDSLDRLLQTVDRLGGTTAYQYNVANRLTRVSAPNGATTQYVYDDLGNELSETSPDRGSLVMTYDSSGNLVQRTDARGITAALSYDALNRVTKIDYPGDADDVTYVYDTCEKGIGRLCKVSDASGTTDYTYTSFGNTAQQIWTTESQSFTTAYTYGATNLVNTITYPDGRVVTYTRDVLGRVTKVEMTREGATTVLSSDRYYRADGLLTAQTFGNGLAESRTYDLQGRLTQLTGGSDRAYQYDANGNILGILGSNQNGSYQYDALDRVTSDQWINELTNQVLVFSYDANGNRTAITTNGTNASYDYVTNSNRLASVAGQSITLDAMGNTLSDGSRRFEYNASGRLMSLYVDGKLRASYRYNAQGLRTHKLTNLGNGNSSSTTTMLYHYDLNGELIAEATDNGEDNKTYVWANGVPIAQFTVVGHAGVGQANGKAKQTNWQNQTLTESVAYLQTDHLGTPRTATDETGAVLWQWQGNAFGDTTPTGSSADLVNLRFPGQYYDDESGLYYNWNRYYDPKTGRYITSDPIGLIGGGNTFIYAQDNPVVLADQFGLYAGPNIDDQANPFGLRGNGSADYTDWFNNRFPKTVGGAKSLLTQRAITKICAHMYDRIVSGLIGGAEDVDIMPDMKRFGDKPQTWYEENVRIGKFQFKTDNIYVSWDSPKCSTCFNFSTTMYVLENTGQNSLGPGFRERSVRMGEWPISGRGCCN